MLTIPQAIIKERHKLKMQLAKKYAVFILVILFYPFALLLIANNIKK